MRTLTMRWTSVALVATLFSTAVCAQPPSEQSKWPLPERMRGAKAPVNSINASTIEWLAEQGANCVLITLVKDEKGQWNDPRRGSLGPPPTKDDPFVPYAGNLKRLDKVLPACRQHRISVIVTLSKFYGWRRNRSAAP